MANDPYGIGLATTSHKGEKTMNKPIGYQTIGNDIIYLLRDASHEEAKEIMQTMDKNEKEYIYTVVIHEGAFAIKATKRPQKAETQQKPKVDPRPWTRKEIATYFEYEIRTKRMVETPTKDAWQTLFNEGYTATFLEKLMELRYEGETERAEEYIHNFLEVKDSYYKHPVDNICVMYICRTEKACRTIQKAVTALYKTVRVNIDNNLYFISAETRPDEE